MWCHDELLVRLAKETKESRVMRLLLQVRKDSLYRSILNDTTKPRVRAAHFLPVAAALTLSSPDTMALTVERMSEKLSNVVKGTFSFSQ